MLAGVLVMATGLAAAQELADVALPAPKMEGGKPLLQVLKDRKSTREFAPQALAPQTLSDLLWAAHGISRADTGKRTAPSAKDCQEIEIYVVTAEGAWLHDVKANSLKAVAKGDFRKLTGKQDFVATAPLNLVYVADTAKLKKCTPEELAFYSATDTGFVGQNVYLFCASEGLATVVRMPSDKPALAAALKLPDTAKITLAQTVGCPKK
jgi:nitroreductase